MLTRRLGHRTLGLPRRPRPAPPAPRRLGDEQAIERVPVVPRESLYHRGVLESDGKWLSSAGDERGREIVRRLELAERAARSPLGRRASSCLLARPTTEEHQGNIPRRNGAKMRSARAPRKPCKLPGWPPPVLRTSSSGIMNAAARSAAKAPEISRPRILDGPHVAPVDDSLEIRPGFPGLYRWLP